ncbi:MAG: serine hydrolase [Ferruginibacter sp.]|nr:serine hydrolase [Ferruginibacter sp.]
MRSLIDETGIPGVSIAIIDHGKIAFSGTYGFKTAKVNADSRTVFEACSLSKTFLVYVAHKLADAGKLDFDRPLFEYLAEQRLVHDERNKSITARMVLCHSSGIENWQSMNNPDTLEILSTPGKRFIYSGEGYNYLAEVISLILNKDYKTYIDEIVLNPLQLKNTFITFSEDGKSPNDYAVGHNALGLPIDKMKNTEPDPASGINTTATDYAKLIVAIFSGSNLSEKRVSDIKNPVIRLNENDPNSYYGPGFAIVYSGKDTIIYQGGDNEGYKACVLYSTVSKTGLVLMTNSDRGLTMVQKLNELSVNINIKSFIEKADPNKQYPSEVSTLLRTYRQGGLEKMAQKLEVLKSSKKMQEHTLDELSYSFLQTNPELSVKLLQENILLNPQDATAYYLMGIISLEMKDYYSAKEYFTKSRELNFPDLDYNNSIELFLKKCELAINDIETRNTYITNISANDKTNIQAEGYNKMEGITIGVSNDIDSTRDVRNLDEGDWLSYKVNVTQPGLYKISLRVRNGQQPADIELQSETKSLTKINIPGNAGNVRQWQTLTAEAELLPGTQMLKLNVQHGGIRINWFEFSKSNPN